MGRDAGSTTNCPACKTEGTEVMVKQRHCIYAVVEDRVPPIVSQPLTDIDRSVSVHRQLH